jgi:hypothetical protein
MKMAARYRRLAIASDTMNPDGTRLLEQSLRAGEPREDQFKDGIRNGRILIAP